MRLFISVFFALTFLSSASLAAGSLSEREGWQVMHTSLAYDNLVEELQDAVKEEGMLLVSRQVRPRAPAAGD